MGAIFRTPPSRLTREALIEQCRLNQIPLIVTALSEDASDIRQADLKHAAVVIGSEGRVRQIMVKLMELYGMLAFDPDAKDPPCLTCPYSR